MPKRPVSREQWEQMVASYRSDPGNGAAAARASGVQYKLAQRAWRVGIAWASFPEARESIQALFAREEEEKRAALRRQDHPVAALRDDAQADAAATKLAEAQMVRLGRASITGLLASTTRIAAGAAQVGDAVAVALQGIGAVKQGEDGKPIPLTVSEVRGLVGLLARVGTTVRQVTEAARSVIEAERLVLGEPTKILGVVHSLEDLTQEEADRRMQAAMRAFERAKDQRLFAQEVKVVEVKALKS